MLTGNALKRSICSPEDLFRHGIDPWLSDMPDKTVLPFTRPQLMHINSGVLLRRRCVRFSGSEPGVKWILRSLREEDASTRSSTWFFLKLCITWDRTFFRESFVRPFPSVETRNVNCGVTSDDLAPGFKTGKIISFGGPAIQQSQECAVSA